MIIAYYESIRQVSHRMVEASYCSDWDAVAAGERELTALTDQMRRAGYKLHDLDAYGRRRRIEILKQVLADDAKIRITARSGRNYVGITQTRKAQNQPFRALR